MPSRPETPPTPHVRASVGDESLSGARPGASGADAPGSHASTASRGLLTALVLAGRRGAADPVAAAGGVSHKALVSLAGTPMLVRVVRSLRAARHVGRIVVSIDDSAALAGVEALSGADSRTEVEIHRSLSSPSASVLDYLERRGGAAPLLLTTADHALLTPEMIDHFCAAALDVRADVVVGVVEASLVRERFPGVRRTFIPLRGGAVKGANLFVFRTPAAARAVAFWRRTERVRKRPWRLISIFGVRALVQFALRRLDLEEALERASAAMGVRVESVRLPHAECAIDVDRPADLALAAQVLAARPPRTAPPTRGA